MNLKVIIVTLCSLVFVPWIVIHLLSKYPHDILTYTGIALFVSSSILMIIAIFQIGSSFTVTPEARELVTKGLYSKFRHPIYISQVLIFLGLAMVVRGISLYLFTAVLLIRHIWRARQENRILEAKFGDVYRVYTEQVWF